MRITGVIYDLGFRIYDLEDAMQRLVIRKS